MNKKLYFIKTILVGLLFCIHSQAKSQVVINEYSCANLSTITDNFGNTPDWIELYNTGGSAVNLAGYHLTDNLNNLTKWTFPAGVTIAANGFLRIWASGANTVVGANIHTSFKLIQTKPEELGFADAAGVAIDTMTLKATQAGHSRGRTTDGAATWGVFTTPTPNATNVNAKLEYATRPSMSLAAGFYPAAQSVTITSPDPLITIYYTTDGSIPTATSTVYTTPVSVTATQVLRAKAFSSNVQVPSSFVESNTYFINITHTMAVVSVFGGNPLMSLLNGTQSNPQTGLEYFDANQIQKAETEGNSNKHGNDSWAYNQRAIDFVSDDELGYNYAVNTNLFINKSRTSFQRIILKAAANDNYPLSTSGACHIRDSYVHTISQRGNLHLDERTWAPCIMYVNGQYWGVYDIREKVTDSDFTDYYYNQPQDSLQMLMTWGGTWSQYGGTQAQTDWNTFRNYVTSNSMTVAANYNYVASQYNIKSLVDYVILNSWAVTSDWLNWNTGWWRGLAVNGSEHKWRYVLWDNDATFGHYINYTGVPSTAATASPCDPQSLNNPGGQGHIPILNKLFTNPTFKQYYISRYIDLMNTTLNCSYAIPLLDSMIAVIQPEMQGQINKWGGSYSQWQTNVTAMRNYILQRCAAIQQGLINCYTLTGPYNVKLNVQPIGAGIAEVNSVTPPSYVWSGIFYGGVQTEFRATANTGYVFDHWQFQSNVPTPNNLNDTVGVNFVHSDSVVAVFVPLITTPTAAFTGSPINLCENATVTFTDSSTGFPISWNWTFTGGTPATFNGQNPPPIAYPTAGSYSVTLIVSNASGSDTSTVSNYITVNDCSVPVANYTVTSHTICENDSIVFTDATTGNTTSWSWAFEGGMPPTFNGQNPPPITYTINGTYTISLTASNTYGANTFVSTSLITVDSCPPIPPVIPVVNEVGVPTAFSPNGDGNNDVLYVLGTITDIDFEIYNRWGQKVFKTNDASLGWDGTFEGKLLNSGVFAYRLSGLLPNGDKVERKGNITLVK